jgi:hypothetical protein
MSEELNQDEPIQLDELDTLKFRADKLGIKYHPSIGLDKLRDKVNGALTGEPVAEEESPAAEATGSADKETEGQRRKRLKKDAAKLVRVRISCMNPNKREWDGEIFTVSNKVVGTFKKFVPFNLDEGYHIPHMIYEQLLARQCQIFVTVKDERGNKVRKGKLIKEFNVEVLPPLTPAELKELARKQALARSID